MRRALLAALLLAGCGSPPPAPQDTPGSRLERAALRAGLVGDPARAGLAGSWAADTDRLCIVPAGRDLFRIGALIDYGEGQGCAAAGTARRRGQTVAVGGPKVTPLAVLEDSRCPAGVQCVWAGRVRISARIDLGSGSETHELTQGMPVPVADGTLELVQVQPAKPGSSAGPLASADYRFALRFMGGL